jgi:Disulphide bond corrector protein DsbC
VVLKHFDGETGANSIGITTGVLTATVSLSADRCFPGQELATSLCIRLKPGWHIYGEPLTGNYQPTELLFDTLMVGYQSLKLPPPSPMRLMALGETLPVYTGEIRAVGKLGIKWSPPFPAKFLESFGKWIEPGLYKIKGTLRFQACSDEVCEMPEAITFELPLTVETGIPPAPKKAR